MPAGGASSTTQRDWRREAKELARIASRLAGAEDLGTLLESIMTGARSLSGAEAGTLYLVEEGDAGDRVLRFSVAQNAAVEAPFQTFTLPITRTSIAGYVAATGAPLRIEDVYRLPEGVPYSFSDAFDKRIGYRTRSMLVVPMTDREGGVVGVIQLINKKALGEVVPFDDDDVDLLSALAAEAGILVERAALYEKIERLLRGFVEAASSAIESRDHVTAGHSRRIASYMVVLAKRMTKSKEPPFADVSFTEEEIRQIFYASLLHDVGKIGVREDVLLKADKVAPAVMDAIRSRFFLLVERARAAGREDEAKALLDDLAFLAKVNKAGFLTDEDASRVRRIAARTYETAEGRSLPLLTEKERTNLEVRRGNLTDEERKEIERHVLHSIEFLERIPWTPDLARVVEIAGTHHEKLDGSGYPYGLKADQIPLEGKMMAIVDIFEALTAMDRPYKPAVPIEKAIAILRSEVERGRLDGDILDFFVKERVWEAIDEDQRRNFTLTGDEILALE